MLRCHTCTTMDRIHCVDTNSFLRRCISELSSTSPTCIGKRCLQLRLSPHIKNSSKSGSLSSIYTFTIVFRSLISSNCENSSMLYYAWTLLLRPREYIFQCCINYDFFSQRILSYFHAEQYFRNSWNIVLLLNIYIFHFSGIICYWRQHIAISDLQSGLKISPRDFSGTSNNRNSSIASHQLQMQC